MGSLHRLVKSAQHDKVKALLIEGVNANAVVRDQTPLELAICNGDVAMVSILIQAGADVNQGHPKTDRRPIDCSVSQPDLQILDLLLAAGADVEGGRETSTPLCIAAAFGKQAAFDRLIKAGANRSATRNGKTADEILASSFTADKEFMHRWEEHSHNKKTDQYAEQVEKMMAEYPSVEEYAAHRGRLIYVYSFDQGVFSDPSLAQWAKDLGAIIRSSELLKQCEEQYLVGVELEDARRERKQLERWHAREERRKERITKANPD